MGMYYGLEKRRCIWKFVLFGLLVAVLLPFGIFALSNAVA